MVQLQENHWLGQANGPYQCNGVASGAPIHFVQLSTTYQISTAQVRYHNFEKQILKVARLPATVEREISLFPFEDCADLTKRLATSKYLMSPWESWYEDHGIYCRRQVPYQGDVYVDKREELESSSWAGSDLLHPDRLDFGLLWPDSNVPHTYFDVLMFKVLSRIKTDFQAAHRRNVHRGDHSFDAVSVDMAL